MTDAPKLWRDMTDAEKGALLLDEYEDRTVEMCDGGHWYKKMRHSMFNPNFTYRRKPEPQVETVVLYWQKGANAISEMLDTDTHSITLTLRDGKPDPVAKVEKL